MKALRPSAKPLALMNRFRLMLSLLTVTLSTGCATTRVPDSLRSCTPAPLGEIVTAADLAALSVRQEQAYQDCDLKRDALVKIIEAGN